MNCTVHSVDKTIKIAYKFARTGGAIEKLSNQTMIILICISREGERLNEKSSKLGRIQILILVCNRKVLLNITSFVLLSVDSRLRCA